MKKRKKQFILIGAVACLIVAGIVVGVVGQIQAERFELNVGGHAISGEEYLNCMESVEYDTHVQIQQEYGAEYTEDFWETKYGAQYGYEILAQATVEQLKYVHAVYDVAVENGDIEEGSYEAAEKRWKAENQERSEKLARGEVIYGLKEYPFEIFQEYEISGFRETYTNDKTREGMDLTEEEIVAYYNTRTWILGDSEENADLETVRVAVIRELREKKYDEMITQRKENSLVQGDVTKIAEFTLKNL